MLEKMFADCTDAPATGDHEAIQRGKTVEQVTG
jgi:hypothetical protein